MSWTVDPASARWFARRPGYPGEKIVLKTTVPKGKVLAYFSKRTESEVVIDPRRIKYQIHEDEVLGDQTPSSFT
jgi:hypothetical protein